MKQDSAAVSQSQQLKGLGDHVKLKFAAGVGTPSGEKPTHAYEEEAAD